MKPRYLTTALSLLALLSLLTLPGTVHAKVYQWVDEQGKVHFSDRKPEQKTFQEKHYSSETPSIDPEMDQYRKTLKLNDVERQRTAEANKKIQAEAQKKANQRKRYCDNLKSRIHIDNDVIGWKTRQPDGSVKVWTGEQRKQYTADLKNNHQKHCP